MENRKQYDNKIILPRNEEHKFSKGKSGLVFCKVCEAVYYKKSWHRNLRDYKNFPPKADQPMAEKEIPLMKFSLCPACEMIKNKQFEGEIIIKNAPAKILNDLKHLIESFCKKAYERDLMHRLIAVKEIKGDLIITTTENQLAVKLAKKIKETFKKVSMKISYSPSPSDVAYVKIEFSPPAGG